MTQPSSIPGGQDHDPEPRKGSGTPEPVHYAEQALLGALLLDPVHRESIGPLQLAHFGHPFHRALFSAIQALDLPDPAEHASSLVWLDAVLDAARAETRGLTAGYLHTLIQACPRTEHAPAYARIIRAEHTRRMLRIHAERLAQTAIDPTLPDPVRTVIEETDTLARFLKGAASLAGHAAFLPRTPIPAAPEQSPTEEELEEERLLLATTIARPAAMTEMSWLRAQDFTSPLHATLFACLTTLVRRGDLVDPVTVLCHAQHHGLPPDIDPDAIIRLLSALAGHPEYWGERILQRSLLAHTHTAAVHIRTLADEPANTIEQLLTGSRRVLAHLRAVQARWQAIQPEPPTPAQRKTDQPTQRGPSPPSHRTGSLAITRAGR
ncbi:DnaB-like helicase N-terminal domain-containing protein [Streptomyces sp. YIM 98790]|uniref:DnaB-like helicase N-terminal domain-containing protein n=1 Tax=Streptomyces sp. YIM 98790 TaxID=2689077 RepID=UPI001409DF6C|nr:DnaB-like helicase N-terminal domain-containing protein [Streptomyces sp. YIM 98790]